MTEPLTVVQLLRFPRAHLFSMERVFSTVRGHLPADVRVLTWACRHNPASMLARLRDAWAVRRIAADVLHVTGDAHYLTWFAPRRRTILTIHDVESLERMRGWKQRLFRWLWYTIPVRRSAAVVVISHATRDALARHVDLAKVPVEVIPNPVVSEIAPKTAPFAAGMPLVLHIGTNANKNLPGHIAALKGLPVRLLIIGRVDGEARALLEASGLAWSSRANLTDEQIGEAYREADILLFASLIEGFGLPVLEAHQAGIPVVTSDRSSLPEVAGRGAVLIDPTDAAAIRAGVVSVLEDEALRSRLIAAGRDNLERFAPSTVASSYADLYRRIAQEAKP